MAVCKLLQACCQPMKTGSGPSLTGCGLVLQSQRVNGSSVDHPALCFTAISPHTALFSRVLAKVTLCRNGLFSQLCHLPAYNLVLPPVLSAARLKSRIHEPWTTIISAPMASLIMTHALSAINTFLLYNLGP